MRDRAGFRRTLRTAEYRGRTTDHRRTSVDRPPSSGLLLFRYRRRDRYQEHAATRGRFCPFGDVRNGYGQSRRNADGQAMLAGGHLQSGERVVDFVRRRDGIDRYIGLGKGQIVGAGDASSNAPGVGAVVDKYQPALFGLLQHRGEGLFGGGESRAHHADEPHIALEPGHQPVQPINVLLRGKRREQRLWARIVVGIIKRLHRHLEQDFVARGARTSSQPGIAAVGHESKGYRAWQLGDRLGGVFSADPKAFDDEGNPDSVRFAGDGRHRLGEGVCRPHAVRSDFRQRSKRRHFEEFRIDFGTRRLRRTAAGGRNHHFLAGARRTVDDIDRGRSGRDRLLALGCGGRASARTIRPAGLAGCGRFGDSHGLVFLAARGLCRRSGLRLDRNDRHWLAAERVVAHDRPDDKNREEKRQHPGNDLGDGEADGGAALPAVLAQRGAQIIRRHRPSSWIAHARITEQSLSRRPNSKPVRTIPYVPRAPRWILAAKKIWGGHWPRSE